MRDSRQNSINSALVLPGGGARGAYQVGVLKAIAELVPRGSSSPFSIISGTSAGAVNSVVLASKAKRYRVAVAELERVWANFHCDQVYRTDTLTMLKSSLHWLASIVLGGMLVGTPKSLLDNSPLRALLSRNVRFPRIEEAIDNDWLDAIAVTAASYNSARSSSFFETDGSVRDWSRTRRAGIRTRLHLDHIMASIAVPMIFPPVRINGEFFGDGAMRQATPLSPAIRLGADRILVIGVRDEIAENTPEQRGPTEPPSFAQIAGYMLDTLFMDGLYSDLERMTRINQLLDSVVPSDQSAVFAAMRPIDTMVIVPSKDIRSIAHKHRKELPVAVRMLLRGIGGRNSSENRLLSYLLFERKFTRELIELGYHDAMAAREQLESFISGQPIPRLFAPHWVREDLDILHRKSQ
ncbi:MAG: patatin-like phospholipase family protein [Woeseiaceae bacterium]|nr:patatin-like phospholipase family protein [Woeseiaceae bacterium]